MIGSIAGFSASYSRAVRGRLEWSAEAPPLTDVNAGPVSFARYGAPYCSALVRQGEGSARRDDSSWPRRRIQASWF